MNAAEWNKLRKNLDDLLQVYPSEVIKHLFSNAVITHKDKKTVEKEKIDSDKMDTLLTILKSKPAEAKAYNALLVALERDPGNSWLVKQIQDTESTADPSLQSEVDPHLADNDVRTVLHKHFRNVQGASVELSEIRDVLEKNYVFRKMKEWSNDTLKVFIKDEFIGTEIKPTTTRVGKFKNKKIIVTNLAKVEPTETRTEIAKDYKQEERQTVEFEQPCKGDGQILKLEKMNPSQLKEFLLPNMKSSHLPVTILDEFVKQNITGDVFLTMTETDFKGILPAATFGEMRFLTMQINSYKLPPPVKNYPEYFHKFDSEVKPTDKYHKGDCVDASINVRGRRTDRIKNFHLIPDQNNDQMLEFIGSEMVPFASACLNDRRNGTIYFGISPSKCGEYEAGEIVGVCISKEEVQAEISDFLKKSFLESQQNLISSTVRDAKFVPVVSDTDRAHESNLWVIEVDIVPLSVAMQEEIVRTKLKCLPIYKKKHKSKCAVFKFSSEGAPLIVESDELYNLEKDQSQIVQQRREEEAAQKRPPPPSNLRTRLLNFLTGGADILQDTIYPFLMTSSIDSHMDEEYLSSNMAFIKLLKPEVVFDFDPSGSSSGIYNNLDKANDEVMRVVTTDNFDKTNVSKEDFKNFINSLANENRISWLFCNGYETLDMDPMEPTEWNRKRRNAFQEALKFYKENFDEERIIVIICLFSKDYKVMIEACDEVLTKLPENWILLAESEDVAKLWQDMILTRNRAEKQALKDRCIIGMTWEQVNLTIKQAMDRNDLHDECLLPTSSGALIEIREKKLKDWCDVDILSAGELAIPPGEREKKEKAVEERFYRGEQVSWFNFLFNQVLKRDIHDELIKSVVAALEGKYKEEEEKVTSVPILHQPGAGGTTSAKQVLWDLRKTYRCCIVNTITDQTCDQIDEIRRFGDNNPKPLLVLIDNEDEDKCLQLRGNLEDRGRKSWRLAEAGECSFDVYCTIILCIRRSSLPKQIKYPQIRLHQELTDDELHWFKVKNESLESRFKRDKERNVNPKFLISFNILRENFNMEYVSNVVKKFSDDVTSALEVQLLKIISFLNTYDPHFCKIQASCLDKIIGHKQNNSVTRGQNGMRRNIKWEANLSQGVRVLLNLSSSKHQSSKYRTSLRVFNKIIAQEILNRMKERTRKKESEIMQELLESKVFELERSDSRHLQTVISYVIRKREYKPDGVRRDKFSKFIIYVKTKEGAEVAVKILKQYFELTQDPFTAQLISRFYIDIKNWNCAEQFAKRATSMLPSCSFLWDTYGQVYKNQLFDKISSDGVQDDDIQYLISLTQKCLEVFSKEQKVSEKEVTTSGDNNFAGYFGELRAIVLLLSGLKMCPSFSKGDTLHRYLVDDGFNPDHLSMLNEQDASYVKSLEGKAKEAMRRLDEEYLQMKGSLNIAEMTNLSSEFDSKKLIDLKVNLDAYFGEENDVVPRYLSEPDSCEYIRRRVRNLGATSLNSILTLRKNIDTLQQIYSLLMKNINSESCSSEDLRIMLDVVTVLLIDNNVPVGLTFQNILDLSKKLYMKGKPQETDRYFLEIFLYFVLYNFPTEERQEFSICITADLSNAIEQWREAFKKNYPKSEREEMSFRRKETTLFFLGNGPPLHDIVLQDSLKTIMDNYSHTEKWYVPQVREKLRMMSGSLFDPGDRVKFTVTSQEGNKMNLTIPTSYRVIKKDMWQKKVFFYIGFSFSGPRAFGISTEELGITKLQTTKLPTLHVYSQTFFSKSQKRLQNPPTVIALCREMQDLKQKIKKSQHPKTKAELEKKKQQVEYDLKKLIGE